MLAYYEVPFTASPLRNLDDATKTSLFRFLILRNTLELVYVKCFLCGECDDHGIYLGLDDMSESVVKCFCFFVFEPLNLRIAAAFIE